MEDDDVRLFIEGIHHCLGPDRMSRLAYLLSVVAVVLWSTLAVAAEDGGTQSPLMLGAGSRPLAMGRAAVAISDDANALFWNPARLAAVQRGEFSLFHTKLFTDDLGYQAGFFTYPTLDLGNFAVGYQRIGADGIDGRDDGNAPTGEFGSTESNLLFGYGREVGSAVAVGATFRIAQQKLQDASDTGIGLDLGVALERNLGDSGDHRWSVGANLQNLLEPKIRLDQEEVADPRNLKLGIGYQGRPRWNRVSLALALDLDLPSEADARVGAGAEIGLDEMFFVRAGADGGHLTLGFGLSVRGVQFDYAMRTDAELARNDRFSLGVRFGAPVDERRSLRQRERQTAVTQELERLLAERETQAYEGARSAADRAFEAEDFEEARLAYRRVLALNPQDPIAISRIDACELQLALRAAQAELDAGETARAMAAYQSVLQRWPENQKARSRLEGLREQIQMAEDREQQLNSLFREALARFSEGDYFATTSSLEELLRLDPEHELGAELLDRTQRLRVVQGEEELKRAGALAERQRWVEALRGLDSARRLLPEREGQITALAETWQEDLETARRQAEEDARRRAEESQAPAVALAEPATSGPSSARVPSPERQRALQEHFEQGSRAFQAGDFAGATRTWQTIWDEWPDFEGVGDYLVKAHLYEAIELYSQGRYRGALEHCRRVLEIDPDNQKAVRYLANIEEEQFTLQELGLEGE